MNGAQALALWGDAARIIVDGTIAIGIGTAAYFLVFLPLAVLLGRTLLKRAGEQLAPLPEPPDGGQCADCPRCQLPLTAEAFSVRCDCTEDGPAPHCKGAFAWLEVPE